MSKNLWLRQFKLLIADILIILEVCGSQFAAASLIMILDNSFVSKASSLVVQTIQEKLRRVHKQLFKNRSQKRYGCIFRISKVIKITIRHPSTAMK